MGNFEVDRESNSVIVSVNSKIFPLEVIYSAAYVFLDRVYVMMDGNPQESIVVQLKAKNSNEDLQSLALEFNNELVSYAVYVVQAARTSEIRKAIVQRALATVEEAAEESEEEIEKPEEEGPFEYVEDPLGIAKPWTPESAKGIKPIGDIAEKQEEKIEGDKCVEADE